MAHYKWQNTMYPAPDGPILAGIVSGDTSIHSTDVMTGTSTALFGWLDSNVVSSAVSSWTADNTSRVIASIQTDWSVTFDSRNNMTVTITVTLVTLARDIVTGNPRGNDPAGRNIRFYPNQSVFDKNNPSQNQIVAAYYHDTDINSSKTMHTNVALGSQTFTLAPGEEANRSSIFIYNKNDTYSWTHGDWINAGVRFINDMPPDYRPGAILKNGEWLSHNRSGGEAHILCGRWSEMRTDNGHSENDNPPSIRMDNNRWTDQLLIGKE